MSLYKLSNGQTADGSSEGLFDGATIPEGTIALATIAKFSVIEPENYRPYYIVKWKIIEGKYINLYVNQNLPVFDNDKPERADKAKNMLIYLYDFFKVERPMDYPTDLECRKLHGGIAQIKIGVWSMEDKKDPNGPRRTGNMIRWIAVPEDVKPEAAEVAAQFNDDIKF